MFYCKVAIFILSIFLAMSASILAEPRASQADNNDTSALDRRIKIERVTRFKSFVLTPHKPNYLLPITYNRKPNNAPVDGRFF